MVLKKKIANTSASDLFGNMISGVIIGGQTYQKKDAQGNLMFTLDPATGSNTKPVEVHQNDYQNMRAVLKDLGLNPKAGIDHETHFHIYLKPPTPKDITKNLSAKEVNPSAVPTGSVTFPQALADYAETLVSGETLMMTVDVPFVPPENPPAILAQAAANSTAPRVDFILKTCDETEHTPNNPRSAFRGVDPAGALYIYMLSSVQPAKIEGIKVTLLQGTQHGELKEETDNLGLISYRFDPNPGYLGDDQAIFLAEYGGKVFRIIYTIKVVEAVSDRHPQCPDSVMMKAPQPTKRGADTSGATDGINDQLPFGVHFADLCDGTLGQNDANGVTLDTTAAGHGWFIDATPSDNSEFLPTSDPNEWIAKQGSEAYGRMDLLTVLLHEYGHALGVEHSTDAHDLMATTLQPGVRRTLSVDEQLMLMTLAGIFVTPNSPSEPYRPSDPGVPLPFTRINGTALYSRIRRIDTTGLDRVPQYDIAANAQLENSQFIPSAGSGQANGWSTTGDVTFADGEATLSENATTQTRLNQVFVLGQDDRTLAFTVANAALGDQENGPDDAFEVALIDASTGLSLLGSSGLTHSDAIINCQADGSEHEANGISVVTNADGSRSYLIDLSGIAAGTVVNLAFDLIGFGRGADARNSQLTIRHLHLGLPQNAPQANDDAVTLAEDTPITINALANDLNASQPGFAPVVVDGPAHGQVTIDPDGRFSYTPQANWNGSDRFSYKLASGQADSNLATVTLTITPVNDAPVIAARSITLDEDSTVIVDLLAGASDVDGDALTVTITSVPRHGTFDPNGDGTWTYQPKANWYESDFVDYEVSDGMVATPARLDFIVTPVNDAPVLVGQSHTDLEDTPINGALLATARDFDAPLGTPPRDSIVLTAIVVSRPQHGQLTVNDKGHFSYTPDANWNGSDSFTYKVNDGELDSEIATVTLTVLPVNDAPLLAGQTLACLEDNAITGNLLATASDVDSADLTATVLSRPQHGQLSVNDDGRFSYTPDANWNGSDSFTYKVNDGELDSAIATVVLTVAPVNDAPTLDHPISAQSAGIGTRFTLKLPAGTFSDVDGDSLSYSAGLADGTPLPAWLSFDAATLSFSGSPPADGSGSYSIRLTARDPGQLAASALFALDVKCRALTLIGTPRNDILTGGACGDTLDGRGGSDLLIGNGGDDSFLYAVDASWTSGYVAQNIGSPGHPGTLLTATLVGKNRSADVFQGGEGDDRLLGTAGDDAIFLDDAFSAFPSGTTGPRISDIEHIDGGAGNDVIDLTSDRYAYGKVTLDGGSGNDVLWSSGGDDTLIGGDGNDELCGGAGSDVYLFDGGFGHDVVTELQPGIGEHNAIRFGAAINRQQIRLSRSGQDLKLTLGADDITVRDWFAGDARKIDLVEFADGTNWSAADLLTLSNQAPRVVHPLADLRTMANAVFTFTLPADTFSDPDPGDLLVYTATLAGGTPLPAWLGFNAQTRTFSGTPSSREVGALSIMITASDRYGLSVSSSFLLNVIAPARPRPVAPACSITVHSDAAPAVATHPAAFAIDWQGRAPVVGISDGDDWLVDYLATRPAPRSLAELTGLVVKRDG